MWIKVTKEYDYDVRSATGGLIRTFAFKPSDEPQSTIKEAGEAAIAAGAAEAVANPRGEPEEATVAEETGRRGRSK